MGVKTNITGGGGVGSDELTATKDYVLEGKEYVGADTDDEKGVGTMVDNGVKSNQSLNASQSTIIKKGYNPADYAVTANSLASQTSATASAGHILSGQTAWVNGSKVTGNITSMGGQTVTPQTYAQTVSTSGKYMSGNITVNGAALPPAGALKKGYTYSIGSNSVTGAYEGYESTPLYFYRNGSWSNLNSTGLTANDSSYDRVTYEANQIKLSRITTAGSSTIETFTRTNQTVNLTDYNYLKISGSHYPNFGVSQSEKVGITGGSSGLTAFAFNGGGTGILNISSMNGWYYIYFFIAGRGLSDLYISEIYLSKS